MDTGHWWRAASLAPDVATLLGRSGAEMLEALSASALIVRVVDPDLHLATLATVREGVVGVTQPQHPRSELSRAAAQRILAWIEAGFAEAVPARAGGSSMVARDVLRGLHLDDDDAAWLVPLAAHSEPLGVLVVATRARARERMDTRRLAAVSEPIAAVLASERSHRELLQLREAAEADKAAALARLHMREIGEAVVGAEAGLREVMVQVEQVAHTPAPVLILGETGSGKEVVARAIHERSAHRRGPILRVNCGAIPSELVDSELFGHERGSFTGAVGQRSGWFERADGGTLFLDEIGELPLAAQVRLLRVLQDGVFERVGGSRPLKVDVRIVAATHRDLRAMVRAGQFREDLWYRINVFVIPLPPLRERLGDIAALADHFAARAARRFGVASLRVTASDLGQLQSYSWPGNVRELSAVIERAAILGGGKRLDIARALGVPSDAALAPAHGADGASSELPTLDQAIRLHIERALARCHGRIEGDKGAAAVLGVHPNTLRSKMHKLGITWSRFRAA